MKLTAAARKKIPAAKFAGPNRSFRVNDANHARAALSMVGRSQAKGNISPSMASKIRAKARMVLGKGSSAGAAY